MVGSSSTHRCQPSVGRLSHVFQRDEGRCAHPLRHRSRHVVGLPRRNRSGAAAAGQDGGSCVFALRGAPSSLRSAARYRPRAYGYVRGKALLRSRSDAYAGNAAASYN